VLIFTAMLSASNLTDFENKGYFRLANIIPADLLAKLRDLFDQLMDISLPQEGRVVFENKGKNFVTNLDHICGSGNLACLELLGYPPILEIARSICGDDFFLIQEFAVIKNQGDDLPVLWHQDMVHQRKGRCFTMGIYLDDVDAGDGALKVVPGSQLDGRPICELSLLPALEVPMQAGDLLIHDMMLAHHSEPLQKRELRRVIYFEFLSAAHVAEEHIYTRELVERRTRLHHLAIRYYKDVHPEAAGYTGKLSAQFTEDESKPVSSVLEEIYALPINARPSAYCLEQKNIFSSFD
jgi:ectoine hydroxylase-related dioxygenase (phytanoyl-CoA dioxygenase family)